MRKLALIIAAQHYDDPTLRELRSAAADAEQLTAVLEDPAIGGYTVTTLVDADGSRIRQAIEVVLQEAKFGDQVLIYLSCHGQKDSRGRLFFAVKDTYLARPNSTGIPSNFVGDLMRDSQCHSILLLLDCCFSGAFGKGSIKATPGVDVDEPFAGVGRVVMTSSTALQYSHQYRHEEIHYNRPEAAPAVFTEAVVRGLRTGEADLAGQGRIEIHDLFTYVFRAVVEARPDQHPTLHADGVQGPMYIATNPRARIAPAETEKAPPSEDMVLTTLGKLLRERPATHYWEQDDEPNATEREILASAARLPLGELLELHELLHNSQRRAQADRLLRSAAETMPVAGVVELLAARRRKRPRERGGGAEVLTQAAARPVPEVLELVSLLDAVDADALLRKAADSYSTAKTIELLDGLQRAGMVVDAHTLLRRSACRRDVRGELIERLCARDRPGEIEALLSGSDTWDRTERKELARTLTAAGVDPGRWRAPLRRHTVLMPTTPAWQRAYDAVLVVTGLIALGAVEDAAPPPIGTAVGFGTAVALSGYLYYRYQRCKFTHLDEYALLAGAGIGVAVGSTGRILVPGWYAELALVACAIAGIVWLLWRRPRDFEAERRWHRAVIARNQVNAPHAMWHLAELEAYLGDTDAARASYLAAAASADPDIATRAMGELGYLEDQQGNISQARRWYERAGTGPHVTNTAWTLLRFAHLAQREKNLEEARRLYRAAIDADRPRGFLAEFLDEFSDGNRFLSAIQRWYTRDFDTTVSKDAQAALDALPAHHSSA